MPTARSTATDSYSCDSLRCVGAGLYDLQFHQLQDLLNQVGSKLGFATITVNGIIDVSNTLPLYTGIASTGQVAGITMPVDVPYTPEWIASNVSALIASLQWSLGQLPDSWRAGILSAGITSRGAVPVAIVDPVHTADDPTTDQATDPNSPTGQPQPSAGPTVIVQPASPSPMTMPSRPLSKHAKWGIAAFGIAAGILTATFLHRT